MSKLLARIRKSESLVIWQLECAQIANDKERLKYPLKKKISMIKKL